MKTILIANRKGGCGKTVAATTLAAALAARGDKVALADADPQKSSLRWLKKRPDGLAPIRGMDWTKSSRIGDVPKKCDWLVVDAPGAVDDAKAQELIAEARAVIVPVMPSYFDVDSTRRFLREIEDIKRIRKGQTELNLLANRIRPRQKASERLRSFFVKIGQAPVAWITERAAYGDLAEQGQTIFDRPQKLYDPIKAQWAPVLSALT